LRRAPPAYQPPAWPNENQLVYVLDFALLRTGQLALEVAVRHRKQDGEWSQPRPQRVPLAQVPLLPDPADRQALAALTGARGDVYGFSGYYDSADCRYNLAPGLADLLLPPICRTGRCLLKRGEPPALTALRWDEGGAYELWLCAKPDEAARGYLLSGELRRGEERVAINEPLLLLSGGLVFWPDRVAPLRVGGAFEWVLLLRQRGPLGVRTGEVDAFLGELLKLPRLPRLDFPEELRVQEVTGAPRPRLRVKQPAYAYGRKLLHGELSFDYEGQVVEAKAPGGHLYVPGRRLLVRRAPEAEAAALERLLALRFKQAYHYYGEGQVLELGSKHLPAAVRALLAEGWHVEAEGRLYRRPGNFHIAVTSDIDWFDLDGKVDFEGLSASLPELLAALRRGDGYVTLDDGTLGMLPEEWLRKYGALAGLGERDGDTLRFRRSQAGLLDALLAAQPEATCDAVFARVRDELHSFAGVEPAEAPPGFTGQLRNYQREGLGWLLFLQRFGFGGCLADDMGLGKTVQVLALLETRRALRAVAEGPRPAPSLVVVPRSLIFNWKEEAARFTPQLRVHDQTGPERARDSAAFAEVDLVLTTYGTLRRDAHFLKDFTFDYCILDEAQAIKNSRSESAKAARLLRGEHRLALSGTPVENHLGELWSLFEFLNPGMLGSASVFQLTAGRTPDAQTRELLARTLRPFVLRRTKEQVAKDLPAKTEQTLYCELEGPQRRRYDELRDHYRLSVLGRVEREGIQKSTMSILEALLRLRQAACHPGLIDPNKTDEGSAKMEALLPQLEELLEEGHKVLVFSQFVHLLQIVRQRLDEAGLTYEYLDGKTTDRQARVERFQNDPACKLFLISLKAGGLGLNLTAASYVFLLDPWWNPAVEAQAIDRTHRIGQDKPVFAYRLIARGTVEEKILELQRSKRDLADAIINADNGLVRNLTREDLELLLS
jgi:superfamily II DNA or RNA helicase